MYRDRRREPIPRSDLPGRRQRGPVLQGLRVGRDDREHRATRQEDRREARDRRTRVAGCAQDDLIESIRQEFRENEDLPEHHQPRRLGARFRARRASASSSSAPSSTAKRPTSRAVARSSTSAPGSTSRTMAIAKVLGIETEYGIAGGPDADPIASSSIIVNAYAQQGRTRINWDFEGETPDMDARGRVDLTSFAPIVETHLANTVLTNGARLYVDHAHPEYSSPECRTPLEATLYDAAGEEVMRRALMVANEMLEPAPGDHALQEQLRRQGQLLRHPRELSRAAATWSSTTSIRAMVPHFVSRQIVVGAGKVGAETEPALESATRPSNSRSVRVLRRGRRTRDDAEAPDHQHPRRAAQRRRAVSSAARHHRRRQHEPGGDLRETRLDGPACSPRSRSSGLEAFPGDAAFTRCGAVRGLRRWTSRSRGRSSVRTSAHAPRGTSRTSSGTLADDYVERHRRPRPSLRPTRSAS